jgi:hypothetical protein
MFITVNGIRLYYEKYGEGRPLVMLHGNGEDCTIFDRAWPILEKRFCCYLVDSRSHGQSEEGELHYETMAKDMLYFLDMLDLRDVIFYGFSDGGIVGLTTDGRLVYSYEKLVESLAEANGWSREDAVDWIEFNTLRSLPYIHGKAPVVMNDLDPDDFLFKQLAFTGARRKRRNPKLPVDAERGDVIYY